MRSTASEGPFSDIAKNEFHRNRPWVVDPSIQTCAPHRPSQDMHPIPAATPLSDMAWAWCWRILMPSHAQAILARLGTFAENRLVCGMHFRSDIVAGQQFGTIMAIRLMQNPQFQADMAAAKAELQRRPSGPVS